MGGGLVVVNNQLLLTANRRRQGMLEWTPPGGVIDDGESVMEGIAREVLEETGFRVDRVGGLPLPRFRDSTRHGLGDAGRVVVRAQRVG